jgi:hypothetical protein
MKTSSVKRSIVIVLALLFLLGAVLPAASAGDVRVWVEYRPGAAAYVRGELQRAGAQFHYQFDQLQSFVVSVPEMAMNGLSRNPECRLHRNRPGARAGAEYPGRGHH